MEEKKDKRVLVLTIIAIATMVVVVAGTTLAYLANTVQDNATSSLGVQTNATSDLFIINADNSLIIEATEATLPENGDDIVKTFDASVMYQTNNPNGGTAKYAAELRIMENEFKYSSGACYVGSGVSALTEYTTYETCTGAGKSWAKSRSGDYACYAVGATVSGVTDEPRCLLGDNYWAQVRTPELVLDYYSVRKDLTDASACSAAGYTLGTLGTNNVCYKKMGQTIDLTEKATWNSENGANAITIFADETLETSSSTSAEAHYMGVVTLKNLDHNQVINGQTIFNAEVYYSSTSIVAK